MKVELDFENFACLVTKEPNDPIFRNGGWAGGYGAEHRFFYHVKLALQKQGYDVIKKRMVKDGHLVSEGQPYVRTRRWLTAKKDRSGEFAIFDGDYQIRDAAKVFNEEGKVCLYLEP